MNIIKKALVGTVLGAALIGSASFAATEEELSQQAAELQQALLLSPQLATGGNSVAVSVEGDRLVISGQVENLEGMNAIQQTIDDMEGLDADMVDNNVIAN